MALQLATGLLGGSAQLPTRGSGTPTLTLSRDRQALRAAGQYGAGLGAVSASAKAAAAGKSLLAVAGGGVIVIEAVLADMKTAATSAKAAGLSDTERAKLHNDFEALKSKITAIVDRTLYGDIKILDGGGGASRSFSFGTGSGSEPGADTTVAISAAGVAQLAGGLDTADLLTQATAVSAEALVITAQETAAGIKGALRADQVRFDAATATGAAVASGAGAVRDAGLEYQGIFDVAREAANGVALDAGLNIYGRDGGLKAGNGLATALLGSLNRGTASTSGGNTEESKTIRPPASRSSDSGPSKSDSADARSSSVDISA